MASFIEQSKSNPIESLKEKGEVSLDFLQLEPRNDYSRLINLAGLKVPTDRNFKPLVKRYTGRPVWAPYSFDKHIDSVDKINTIEQNFSEAIPGSIVCDLGGYGGGIEFLAAYHNASLFINVDRYPELYDRFRPDDPTKGIIRRRNFIDPQTNKVLIEGVHRQVDVRADMLDFASRLKDESVNISINGIDSEIIPVPAYHRALAKEIVRVTKHNGIIFGHNSYPVFDETLEHIKNDNLTNEFEVIFNKTRSAYYGSKKTVVIRRK